MERTEKGSVNLQANLVSPVSDNVKAFCIHVSQSFEPGEDVSDITDRFFEHIEDNRELLQQYNELVENNSRLSANAQIGRWIKDYYQLGNGEVVPAKRSRLIQAYTTHSRL